MNPHSGGEAPSQHQFEIPAAPEAPAQAGELSSDQALEKGAPDENRVGKAQPQQAPAVMPVATPPVIDDQAQAATKPDPSKTASDGVTANDRNIIEKIWINKAKQIIAQTQEDPFTQKKEMGNFKAEYIQKRFNKSIPTESG